MDEDVSDLSPIKLCWSIQVKVLNKWRERSARGRRSVRMVLADERVRMDYYISHEYFEICLV